MKDAQPTFYHHFIGFRNFTTKLTKLRREPVHVVSLCNNYFHPGRKCEAFRLGVHLILLYFIRISLLTPKTFVLFGGRLRVGDGGVGTIFPSLNILIIIWNIV